MGVLKIFSRENRQGLNEGLHKTRESFLSRINRAVTGKSVIDEEVLDNLEEALIAADVGIRTTVRIIEGVQKRVARDKYLNARELKSILREEIAGLFPDPGSAGPADFTVPPSGEPYVILVVGVNGAGKTTTIGKLAYQYRKAGNSVLLGAADTFRAAAVDQLTIWSERAGVPIIKQPMGSDPGAVAFDTVKSGMAKGMEVILIDTAGRLHNKAPLMEELGKIRRVIKKVLPRAPHEVLLVVDGSTGQNALEQARQFTAVTEVTAIAITKLDGTARGGVVLAIADQFRIPVKYIGLGEKIEDLRICNIREFVDSLLDSSNTP